MSSVKPHQLHVYFLPLMAPGHMIPMMDIARKFARHGARATIITTPSNASKFTQTIERDRRNGFQISVTSIRFPCREAGLPEGCENLSSTTTPEMSLSFIKALDLLREPVEKILEEGSPDCIVSGAYFWWTTDAARKLGIPRVVFYGTGFFPLCVWEILQEMKLTGSEDEEFVVPGLPDEIRVSTRQLPEHFKLDEDKDPMAEINKKGCAADLAGYGIIMNTFYELEPAYAEHYRGIKNRKAWHIGPVSLINNSIEDKIHRGQEMSSNAKDCLSWLDSKKPNSVIYICFGSMSIFQTPQLHEIAHGLESASVDFVWVVKKPKEEEENSDYLPEGFESRIEGRGLIIRGWAPQVQILDHEAVGGFVTHCGWNSLLEGVATGVPMVTWPLSAEQFFNEKLVVEILKTGVPVGAEGWTNRTDKREALRREKIERAVVELMVGEGGERMRDRARELGKTAKRAVEKGGSSDADFNCLIEEIRTYRGISNGIGNKIGDLTDNKVSMESQRGFTVPSFTIPSTIQT